MSQRTHTGSEFRDTRNPPKSCTQGQTRRLTRVEYSSTIRGDHGLTRDAGGEPHVSTSNLPSLTNATLTSTMQSQFLCFLINLMQNLISTNALCGMLNSCMVSWISVQFSSSYGNNAPTVKVSNNKGLQSL